MEVAKEVIRTCILNGRGEYGRPIQGMTLEEINYHLEANEMRHLDDDEWPDFRDFLTSSDSRFNEKQESDGEEIGVAMTEFLEEKEYMKNKSKEIKINKNKCLQSQ